ncbi:Flavoredoxin [bioreactor metagenome]|uniref:Flavoredoxin n=1 Tax=bioreactor metagenome TaxID=1076179 RepID=A0A645A242_9ZZZZ|nr:flavin reductase family protein [Candidatus Metalachnospira sp.]
MSKEIWKPGTLLYPVPAVMISCGTMDKPNIITIAWCGTLCTSPAMTYISVRPERFSYDIIKKSGEFVINLTTEQLAYATDYCGVRSGKDVDKFKETGLTAAKSLKVSAPSIDESPVNIECIVKDVIKTGGSHDIFIAEVVSVSVDKNFFDERGKFHFEKTKPICYSHGEYFGLGKSIGSFGYSVKKTKNSKKKKRV